MRKEQKKLTITIEPEIDKLLESGAFNKSKLINKLLSDYLKNLPKTKK